MKKYTIVALMIFSIYVYLIACVNVRTARKNPTLQDMQIKQATETNHYSGYKGQTEKNEERLKRKGKKIFRFDTFHDEQFWTDQLQLQKAIAGKKYGGIGNGLTPMQALELGLKVDRAKLTPPVAFATKIGLVPLDSRFITMLLLKMNAVVGVKAKFQGTFSFHLKSIGITCASCHSTTDNSIGPGIGRRLDGWPNRDLDVGKIITLSPDLKPLADLQQTDIETLKKVLLSWGPGKFDAEYDKDGIGFRPDGKTAATLIPAAFGQAGVNLHTYTGWGSVTHWNAYVANTELQGQGNFYDPRMNDPKKFPLAVRNNGWNIKHSKDSDFVTSKLAALHFYQLSLPAPKPRKRTYDQEGAQRGEILFNGKAQCASCHVPPIYTEPGYPMHTAEELGIDDFQAKRSPDEKYRTMPLKGLFVKMKGGFYHDGRFADLLSVVDHYNTHRKLMLTEQEKKDIVEFLKSL
jgi:mono/diheme cytochrome c family protein